MNPHWVNKNFNPWGKRIPDCGIRAVSAGLRMSYPFVCALFGKKYVPGTGLKGNDGLSLDSIKGKLDKFFDVVQDCRETAYDARPEEFKDMEFDPEIDGEESLGMTLNEFCDLYAGTGRYLVTLTNSAISREINGHVFGHTVFCNLNDPNNPFFVDTEDWGDQLVTTFMRIDKVLSRKNPHSLDHIPEA